MELAIEIPSLVSISILNSRTISAMELSIEVPSLVSIEVLNGRTISAMELTIEAPFFVSIGVSGHCRLIHVILLCVVLYF